MSYDGEVEEKDWCPVHSCYRWQCPSFKKVEEPKEYIVALKMPPHQVGGLSVHQCSTCFALVVEDFMPDHIAVMHLGDDG